jgi:predicted XRE-type DNA-binding protein
MTTMKHKNTGESFDSFLEQEDILDEVEEVAIKRVIALQLQKEMKKRKLSKKNMAAKMHTSRSSLDRLLNPDNEAVTFKTLRKAANVLGKRLEVRLV